MLDEIYRRGFWCMWVLEINWFKFKQPWIWRDGEERNREKAVIGIKTSQLLLHRIWILMAFYLILLCSGFAIISLWVSFHRCLYATFQSFLLMQPCSLPFYLHRCKICWYKDKEYGCDRNGSAVMWHHT